MNAVEVITIALGLFIICSRGPLLIAPGPYLLLVRRMAETNIVLRTIGVALALLGGIMIQVGGSESSILAGGLFWCGLWIVAIASLILIVFPNLYREILVALVPNQPQGPLPGWRLLGAFGIGIGLALIYFGITALQGTG